MTEAAKTIPIVIRIPDELGLSTADVKRLETKWQKDLSSAVADSGAKIKFNFNLNLQIQVVSGDKD